MGFRGAGIIVWKGKAYLPCFAQYESGIMVQVEPVYTVELEVSELLSAIDKVLSQRQQLLPDPTEEEWKRRKDPILAAIGAKSWRELAKKGYSYGIEWIPEGIRLDISRLDKKGRWEIDPTKVQIFLPDTPLKEIVEIILEDLKTRQRFSSSSLIERE